MGVCAARLTAGLTAHEREREREREREKKKREREVQ